MGWGVVGWGSQTFSIIQLSNFAVLVVHGVLDALQVLQVIGITTRSTKLGVYSESVETWRVWMALISFFLSALCAMRTVIAGNLRRRSASNLPMTSEVHNQSAVENDQQLRLLQTNKSEVL